MPLVEVLRGATGEIEDYARVDLDAHTQDRVAGGAVADVTHLLAELIENAANYSPPGTQVRVVAYRAASGLVVEIEDRGIGIPPDTLAVLNHRLANPPEFDLVDADQLGLFVVSRLADRQRSGSRCGCPPTAGQPPPCCCPTRSSFRAMTRPPAGEKPPGAVLRSRDCRPAPPPACAGDARSPDQARALISSIRQGWRNGSAADPNPDSDTDGAQA